MQRETLGAEARADVVEVVLAATRALVGLAARSLATMSEEVSLAQHRVLVLLEDRGPQTMGWLADQLEVTPSTVTRVCDRLADKGLVRRRQDTRDRRAVRLELSAKGKKLVAQVMSGRRRHVEEILAVMTPEAQQRLRRSLTEFAAAAGELSDEAWVLGWSNGARHGEHR